MIWLALWPLESALSSQDDYVFLATVPTGVPEDWASVLISFWATVNPWQMFLPILIMSIIPDSWDTIVWLVLARHVGNTCVLILQKVCSFDPSPEAERCLIWFWQSPMDWELGFMASRWQKVPRNTFSCCHVFLLPASPVAHPGELSTSCPFSPIPGMGKWKSF